MGNVDDADALGRQGTDRVEEHLRFAFADGRCRLVHDQDVAAPADRLGDLDELRLGNGEIAQPGADRDVKLEAREDILGLRAHAPVVDEETAAPLLPAEIEVLGHGHVEKRAELLCDDGDACIERVGRRSEFDLPAADGDPSRIASQQPHQNAEEGRFAGAVAPAERVHGAGPQRDPPIDEGGNLVEGF
ncbi:hypothetical protein AKG11_06615 [Shinella sp. SUS2]|nr:hypothetical protein AKG11_06615 [Shinella sp. SUS2]KOC75640.1 hypothetical protein AKG10_10670 [Shinella sp. GWS1]